jgi:altered-inheritance-of-mitochondria protein 13
VTSELQKLQEKSSSALQAAHEKVAAFTTDAESSSTSRHTVSAEVTALKARLDARKGVRELPEGVETARAEVIRCLREKDRRPLDCWQEVERFKAEVKKMEKGWVEKVVS